MSRERPPTPFSDPLIEIPFFQAFKIESPPGTLVGHIKRKWNSFSLIFTVDESSTGTRRLKIKGPSYIDWVCRSLAHCIFPYCLFHCLCNSVSSFKLIDTAKNKKVNYAQVCNSHRAGIAIWGGSFLPIMVWEASLDPTG